MVCERIDLGNGHAGIICHRRSRPKPCSVCGVAATKQCDFPVAGGRTCDKRLCDRCAVNVGPNMDHCPVHPPSQLALAL